MEDFEIEYKKLGYTGIVGIDEVGRGSFFGDVIACAIVMPDTRIEGVSDSKKLTAKKREELYEQILKSAVAVGIGRVDAKTIDEINIKQATRRAMKMAVDDMRDQKGRKIYADLLLIDAERIDSNIAQISLIKGDDRCYSIACASIVAKVYRDSLCNKWDEEYPGYNIRKNKGYGTKEHSLAILEKGYTKMHRLSFLGKLLAKNE